MGQNERNDEQPLERPRRRCGRWCRVAVIVTVIVAILLGIGQWVVNNAEPMLRRRIVDSLSARLNSRVVLQHFHVSLVAGLSATGSGLQIYPNDMPSGRPLATVEKFSFHTHWHDLFRSPMNIALVKVSGLHLNIPPKQVRQQVKALHPMRGKKGSHKQSVNVERVQVDHAVLNIISSKPGKPPLMFVISNVRMGPAAQGKGRPFSAQLINPKPVGAIATDGYFGPFDAQDPGATPVSGDYSFAHADLGTIKGIGGMLSSKGHYQGQLNQIVVDGETDTPDFSLSTANTPVPLHTQFHAIVDGTNGNTYLEPVNAMLNHSKIVARGEVVHGPGGQGHEIDLQVESGPANIEDFLRLAVKTTPPLMSGAVTLHFSLKIPPGKVSVVKKLQLDGTFQLKNAHFNNPKFQAAVDELSLRAQGQPKKAKTIGKARKQGNLDQVQMPDTASQMQGHFNLGNGKLRLQHLVYTVKGAVVGLDGVYSLDGKQFDLHGVVRTSAKASQMVTGWKRWALKIANPFLSKKNAGMQVPIQIHGTRSSPHFGLDFKHRHEDEKALPKGKRVEAPPQ
uniref:AsmA-like C-terminal domain-containing protein n=1 Tax=Acidobacterium capsulatum TaxID=33075 RepID=A0A7V4XQP8_9BACT